MFGERYKFEEKAKQAENEKNKLDRDLGVAQGVGYLWRAMAGDETFKDDKTEEHKEFKEFIAEVDKNYEDIKKKEGDGGKDANPVELTKREMHFKNVKELFEAAKQDLGWNNDTFMFNKKYRDVMAEQRKAIAKA